MTSKTSIAMWRSMRPAMPVCVLEGPESRLTRLRRTEAVNPMYAIQPASGQPVPAVSM